MGRKRTLAVALTALAVVVTLGAPVAAYLQPSLIGADQVLIVLTGSMEPSLSPGDVVFVAPASIEDIEAGDIVNFEPHPGAGETYTHRVVEVVHDARGTVLTTQGDANEDPDPMAVNDAMLQGKIVHTIPALGKAIVAVQSKVLPLVLVVGAILTVGFEVNSLLAQLDGRAEPRRFRMVGCSRRFNVVSRR